MKDKIRNIALLSISLVLLVVSITGWAVVYRDTLVPNILNQPEPDNLSYFYRG